jgi:hypothetical protein
MPKLKNWFVRRRTKENQDREAAAAAELRVARVVTKADEEEANRELLSLFSCSMTFLTTCPQLCSIHFTGRRKVLTCNKHGITPTLKEGLSYMICGSSGTATVTQRFRGKSVHGSRTRRCTDCRLMLLDVFRPRV